MSRSKRLTDVRSGSIASLWPSSDYYLMSVYSFVTSFRISEYGLGSAIAVVMVLIMFAVTSVYVRQMVKAGEVR